MAKLVSVGTEGRARQYVLDRAHHVIGRAADCDISIADQLISRRHARFVRGNIGFEIEDLGSVNGTFLNARRLDGTSRLADGDVITIGGATFLVDLSDERVDAAADARVTVLDARDRAAELVEVANVRQTDAVRAAPLATRTDAVREVERLQQKLRTVYELSETIASSLEPRALLQKIVDLLLELFPQAIEAAAIAVDPQTDAMRTLAARRRASEDRQRETVIPLSVVNRILREGRSVLLRAGGAGRASDAGPRGFRMGAPLSFKRQPLGILHVEARVDGESFDQADLDLLGGIAAQSGVALHLVNLHERSLVQDRFDKDLVIARQIQRSLLPRETPRVDGMAFAVHYAPAYQVGGDFFDFVWCDPNHLAIVVGDVSGKAVSGAIFMARVASEIRAQAPVQREPHEILERVNRAIAGSVRDGVFCTAMVMCVDLSTRVARYANAGHTAPLLRRGAEVRSVDAPEARSVPLGIEDALGFRPAEVELRPGDVVMLYTDGLLDARNSAGESFGEPGIARALAAGGATARSCVDRLLRDLDGYVGDGSQQDDQTVVCVETTPGRLTSP